MVAKLNKKRRKETEQVRTVSVFRSFFTSLVICQAKTIPKFLPKEQKLNSQTYKFNTRKKELNGAVRCLP